VAVAEKWENGGAGIVNHEFPALTAPFVKNVEFQQSKAKFVKNADQIRLRIERCGPGRFLIHPYRTRFIH